MNIKELIKNQIVYFDGGMGTLLQERGLQPGELPETWNILHPEIITDIHRSYFEAGANIIKTNTFGANRLKFDNLEEIITKAVENANKARDGFENAYIALDIGPIGKMLKPLGDLDFEKAVEIFAETVKIGSKLNVDLILIETMNDSYETKAAVLAAKENSDLPIFVTTVYDENAKLMTGANPKCMVAILEGLGVDALGLNCSLGPEQMKKIVPMLTKEASIPVIVNPNAGLPRSENGKTVYDVDADEFSDIMVEIAESGARILGGCCGTTPEFIRKTIEKTKSLKPQPIVPKNTTLVSSYTHAVEIGPSPILIGERINPTGKSKFKEALRQNNMDYILNEGIAQQEKGVQILDVNVGLPEIDEVEMIKNAVFELQSVIDLPLQIDTVDIEAMEQSMRLYNGKPLVNSVNGKEKNMKDVFPLIKKYGGTLIALTIDEDGIPETVEGRIKIAEKIIKTAKEYGIDKKDIVVDPLAMTISSDTNSANITLETVKRLSNMEIKTSLGVSNISFGLPNREFVTSTFFAMALQNGLNCAIMNPYSQEMMKVYYCFNALTNRDDNCTDYINFCSTVVTQTVTTTSATGTKLESNDDEPLKKAIIKGLKEQAAAITAEMLKTVSPLDLIDTQIIPALDIVGKGFEEKTVFLPQLLMSAEASKSSFDVVKASMASNGEASKGRIILATVKGDIHDIGKNIVKVLLENYGYEVIDLGKDVPPELVCETAIKEEIDLVGLSALMTTTVPSMEETIKQLREKRPQCKVVVGGAVLTQEYADMIGADYYAKDAMETVRYAEHFFGVE